MVVCILQRFDHAPSCDLLPEDHKTVIETLQNEICSRISQDGDQNVAKQNRILQSTVRNTAKVFPDGQEAVI